MWEHLSIELDTLTKIFVSLISLGNLLIWAATSVIRVRRLFNMILNLCTSNNAQTYT